MPRINLKGGIWTNTEDEVLKCAVMKYGKNHWARVASLIHRKTAKQCKARWYEWLDPSIKKTEWSQEEEEKLLHLAKMMPTQWRTIAPLVGRTASQCLERYEYLLDRAQQKDGDMDASDDPRRLKPGEIDPNPESKPARPDPVDMDEDELEMLSEARARLANTQGKKAKRKAREKQLEEARRLASLQKRRELRQAGIHVGVGSKRWNKKGINYLNEIPFEKQPQPGFYDTSMETFTPLAVSDVRRAQFEARTKAVEEAKEKKHDKEKMKRRREENMPEILAKMAQEPEKKRCKLVLPEPQISERELEQLIKHGAGNQTILKQAEGSGAVASLALLNDYSLNAAEKVANLRTPRLPTGRDALLDTARDIVALNHSETPLVGGRNAPLSSDVVDKTGKLIVPCTPNTVLSVPLRTPAHGDETPGVTPGRAGKRQLPAKTPVRDGYNLNIVNGCEDLVDPRDAHASIVKALVQLPVPKDIEIEISLDEVAAEEEERDEMESAGFHEDQGELERKAAESERLEKEREFRSRSQVFQRSLPRPAIVNEAVLRSADEHLTDLERADELVKTEMLAMLHYDNLNEFPEEKKKSIPPKELKRLKSASISYLERHEYTRVSTEDLEPARRLIDEEVGRLAELAGHGEVTYDRFEEIRDECQSQLLRVPSSNKFTKASLASKRDKIESLEARLDANRKLMAEMAKKAAKLEKKHCVLVAGYLKRSEELAARIGDLLERLEKLEIQHETFKMLREQERLAAASRLTAAEEDVHRQAEKHDRLQRRYAELSRRKAELLEMKRTAAAVAVAAGGGSEGSAVDAS